MIHSIQSHGTQNTPEDRSTKQAENDRRINAVRATEGGHSAESKSKSDKTDSIQFSDAALEASSASGKVARSGTLSPQRLDTITGRMADGFYDSAAVRHEIARRLLPDL